MTAVSLKIIKAGPGNTIQDGGRHGWLRFGVTPAGPMDWISHAVANAMAENSQGAAAIEVTIGGIELEVNGGPVTLAYAGPGFLTSRNGSLLPASGRVTLAPDDRLAMKAGLSGSWGYVAPAADIDLAAVMGSLSTHTRSGIGGLDGRTLQICDVLRLSAARLLNDATLDTEPARIDVRPFRVIFGPQNDYFTERGLATLTGEIFTLSTQMDRMAYWLDGPKIEHAKGYNIISDGIALGSIQVPGNGVPLVLMADRQPTGGYPKIATVIRADIPGLAQIRAGARLQFARTDMAAATAALAEAVRNIAKVPDRLRTTMQRPQSEMLLEANLVSGVISATD